MEHPLDYYREFVTSTTQQMRNGTDIFWVRFRESLSEKGLDPKSVFLANIWSEDTDLRMGYFVTGKGEIFEFEFKSDKELPSSGWNFRKWKRIEEPKDCYSSEGDVLCALQIINEDINK